ncbi:MAG: hypothetical protein ABFD96_23595, partial [Armatimonadia bacterium]
MRKLTVGMIVVLFGLSLIAAHAAERPAPVQKAVERLATVLDVNPEAIEVLSFEFVEWPDSSLGVPRKDMGYLPVITPGYKVFLGHDGRRYEYHTNLKDKVVLATSEPEPTYRTGQPAAGTKSSPAADRCRADLARRLKADLAEITVGKIEPKTFTDGSLGLPRPGEVYTKAIESGYFITLSYQNMPYLYAATDHACRYGGPVSARQFSALYIDPIENEPNMNGNLVQVALAGDNPRVVMELVSDFRPQPDGSIIAKRRTSRSGHELWYLAPGKYGQPVQLAGAMDFVDAAVSVDGTRWAAISRPRLGMGWELISGPAGQKAEGEPVALPDGMPRRVYMHLTSPVVLIEQRDGARRYYELAEDHFRPIDFVPPELEELVLNKSETLVIDAATEAGKPVTRVIYRWFTGDDNLRAAIPGFEATEWSFSPHREYLLLSGKSGDTSRAYTVHLRTGEVLETVAEAHGPVRLLAAPSARPIVMDG